MALNPSTTVASRNLALNAAFDVLNSGFLDIYDGTQPASADTAITSQVKLAHLTLSATAFAAASSASKTANTITADSSADATGTATWYRLYQSNGTTAVMDGSVGTSGANLNLNTVSIVAGASVAVSSFTVTQAA